MAERVWFMGPWEQPGFFLRVSTLPARSRRLRESTPPDFAWKCMDRNWGVEHKPQGTTTVVCSGGWTVLAVADYTVDSRPNVMVSFAVQLPDVPEAEMRRLAAERYPTVWERLGVPFRWDPLT